MNTWINLNLNSSHKSSHKTNNQLSSLSQTLKLSLPKPPLYSPNVEDFETTDRSLEIAEMTKSRAFKAALSPGSSMVMYLFVFWMMGSNLNIFTIFFFFNAFMTPIRSIMNLDNTFKALKNEHFSDFGFYKLLYILVNVAVLMFVLYKLYGIGLVPLNPSDYLEILPTDFQTPSIPVIFDF